MTCFDFNSSALQPVSGAILPARNASSMNTTVSSIKIPQFVVIKIMEFHIPTANLVWKRSKKKGYLILRRSNNHFPVALHSLMLR